LSDPFTLDEFENLARTRVPAVAWDYVQGGAGRESTIAANRALFDGLLLRPRMLVDVTDVDPCVEVLGTRLAMPVGVAPMAYHRLMHPDGESATVRAAGVHTPPGRYFASIETISACSAAWYGTLIRHAPSIRIQPRMKTR